MARPRIPIGTFGKVSFLKAEDSVYARANYRDWDGRLRLVQASGSTPAAAERSLKVKLAERNEQEGMDGELAADTKFTELVRLWLEDLDLEGRVSQTTRELYERDMRTLVLPSFEHLVLREVTVRRVDQFLKRQAKISFSKARHSRQVLSLALGLAVRYDAILRNPVQGAARLRRPPSDPQALSGIEVELIRATIRVWRTEKSQSGPKPDGQIGAIVETMLGTSARIGEVLAIRKCDVDVTVMPARVRICGTIISPKGAPTYRQDHPKTNRSRRTVAVPSFTAEALRGRLAALAGADDDHLLFYTRNQTPLTTNNVRRQLRAILKGTPLEGVTPHAFRRTVATVISRNGSDDLAAKMLGHTSADITRMYYIEKEESVDPETATILEALAPNTTEE